MRVLRLDLEAGSIDLHPFVTVARGLTPAARAELVDVLAGLPAGKAPVPGLLEAHGVLLDLDAATLELLDLREPLPVVVTADELPGAPAPEPPKVAEARARLREAERRLSEAEAAAERADALSLAARRSLAAAAGHIGGGEAAEAPRAEVDAAESARVRAEAELRAAAEALAAADKELLAGEVRANEARAERDEATRAMTMAAAALDAAADQRDPVALAAVEAAAARVKASEQAVEAAKAFAGGGQRRERRAADADANLEALRAERLEVEAAVLALETPDPAPVRIALDQLGAGGPVEMVSPPEAIALADRWATIAAELDALEHRGAADGERRNQAVRRIREAREALDAAEVGGRPGVEPDDVVILEAAHAEVLEARDAAERRLGGRNAKRRLEAALAHEQSILDRLGFVTYTEYLMGVPGNQDVPEDPHRVARARLELAEAEAALRRLDDDVAGELRRAELLQQRRAVRVAAVDLLGTDPDDDVEGALRRHRVPAPGGAGGAGRLAAALESAGLVLGDEEMPERFLIDLAKVWLDEQELVTSQRRALEERVADLDLRISDRQRAESDPDRDERSDLTRAVADLEDAKAALRSAEARAARHRQGEEEVVARRQAFEDATEAEAAAVAVVAEAEAEVLRLDEARRAAAAAHEAARANAGAAAEAVRSAVDALAAFEAHVAAARAQDREELEAQVAEREEAADAARAEIAERSREVGEARAALAVAETEEAPEVGEVLGEAEARAAIEETEWYMLARLAAQRAASYAGSVPFVLDDALSRLDATSAREVLERLERMAATVQVVVVTEDLATAAWASGLGPERAAVVEIAAS